MDRYLDARLLDLLDHVRQQVVVRHADEHLGPVAGRIGERAVRLRLVVHINGAEDVPFYAVGGALGLESVHLLPGGVERQPPVLDGEILDTHVLQELQGLVDVELAVGVTGDADLEIVRSVADLLGLHRQDGGERQRDGEESDQSFHGMTL